MYRTKKFQGKVQALFLVVFTGRQLMAALQKLQMGYACEFALDHTPAISVREVAARLFSLCPVSVSFLTFALFVWSVQIASLLCVWYYGNTKHRPKAPLATSHLDYCRCCVFVFCVPTV